MTPPSEEPDDAMPMARPMCVVKYVGRSETMDVGRICEIGFREELELYSPHSIGKRATSNNTLRMRTNHKGSA